MTSIRLLEFLLILLVHQVYSEEPQPVFRVEGSVIEMGYCFGVDYIAVYRCYPEGDQLIGNSSSNTTAFTPSAPFRGRIHMSKNQHLSGLLISQLTHMDSGIYRRECWKNQTLVSQKTQQLIVCNEEVEPEEMIVNEEDAEVELLCNNTSIGLEGTSVRWYHEKHPSYKLKLFLDSNVSLDPVLEEGVIEVRESGALIVFNSSMLKNNHHFHCLVIKGKNCLSFQSMYQPDRSESWDIFASLDERVVLRCPSDGNNQQWETPLGRINASDLMNNHMYISYGDKSQDFSLVILAVTDEHIGEYSCISPSLEMQYLLVLCPRKESQDKAVFEGRDVSLDCDVGEENDSQRVQWHRRKATGEHELICDSKQATVPIPEDLIGRLTLSEKGSSLAISHVNMEDQGVYWCVVLGDPEFLEDDYTDSFIEEGTDEDDSYVGTFMDDPFRCIFKQETILSLTRRRLGPVSTNFETSPTADPSAASNVTLYAVGAGVAGLLVVGVVIAVTAIKMRTKMNNDSGVL